MNIKLTYLVMLFPLFCIAQQKAPTTVAPVFQDSIANTAFYVKNKDVVYQKVFSSALKKEALTEKINGLLNGMNRFRFNQSMHFNGSEFYGQLILHEFDIDRKELSMFNVSGFISYPLSAVVAVQVKDYKYRVIISDMNFSYTPMDLLTGVRLNELFFPKNGSLIKKSNANMKLTQLLDHEFSTLFNLNNALANADF